MKTAVIVITGNNIVPEEREELIELVHAVPYEIKKSFQQKLDQISFRTYIGKGKCEEIRDWLQDETVDFVIFNQDLSALQIRNLEDFFGISVMDRTELILAIFEQRAITQTARLQVEQAKLEKMLPRLIGANTQLGRQSGSGKNKGTGEKQLELDRRRIKARIEELKRELSKIEKQRQTQRKARRKSMLPLVSLVGYTNAGKSTIMNRFLQLSEQKDEKYVLEQDMLFATLDTSIRQIHLKNGDAFLLSDTVGFVHHLPHSLIKAFASTLEEVTYASLLIQVVDASSPQMAQQMAITQQTLQEIGAASIPMIIVYTKCDKIGFSHPAQKTKDIYINAKEDDLTLLIDVIHTMLYPKETPVALLIPYHDAQLFETLRMQTRDIEREDTDEGMLIHCLLSTSLLPYYRSYLVTD